jgi:hypothetical protein
MLGIPGLPILMLVTAMRPQGLGAGWLRNGASRTFRHSLVLLVDHCNPGENGMSPGTANVANGNSLTLVRR